MRGRWHGKGHKPEHFIKKAAERLLFFNDQLAISNEELRKILIRKLKSRREIVFLTK